MILESEEDESNKKLIGKMKTSKIVDAELTEIVSDEDKSDEEDYLKINNKNTISKNYILIKSDCENKTEDISLEDKNKIEEERIRKDLEMKFKKQIENENTSRERSSSSSRRSSRSKSSETLIGNDDKYSNSTKDSDISNTNSTNKLKRKKSNSNENDIYSEKSDIDEDQVFSQNPKNCKFKNLKIFE
jgi:hypothetical protein